MIYSMSHIINLFDRVVEVKMGNKEIVERINRKLFTGREQSVFEQAALIVIACTVSAFLLGYFVGMQ